MAATQAQLDEAKAAYHRLSIGEATRVFVDQNGERVEFIPSSAARLLGYIQRLEAELGIVRVAPAKPIRFFF